MTHFPLPPGYYGQSMATIFGLPPFGGGGFLFSDAFSQGWQDNIASLMAYPEFKVTLEATHSKSGRTINEEIQKHLNNSYSGSYFQKGGSFLSTDGWPGRHIVDLLMMDPGFYIALQFKHPGSKKSMALELEERLNYAYAGNWAAVIAPNYS